MTEVGVEFRRGYDLEPVARKLEAARQKKGFSAFEYGLLVPVVAAAAKFSPEPTRLGREFVLHKAVARARSAGPITVNSLKKALDAEFFEYLGLRKKAFDVVTHISSSLPNTGFTKLSNSTVYFGARLSGTAQEALRKWGTDSSFQQAPRQASRIRSRVQARVPGEAVEIALDDLDSLRGLWILWATRGIVRLSFGLQRRPLAPVVVGPTHTLHLPTGELALDTYWWRIGFAAPESREFEDKWSAVQKHTAWARRRIARAPIRQWLEGGFRRYAVALDVTDWETAFAKLWAVLEYLTCTGSANYDVTMRRALFLRSAERQLQRQILHHLKDFRNSVVHHDTWSRDTEQLIWHLKVFVDHLLVFLIQRCNYFESPDEVGQFLDLPRSRRLLVKGAEWLK